MTRTISRPSERRPGIPSAAPLLRRIATDPAAPLIATIVGPGGTGKSATLDAVAHGYQQAGIEVLRPGTCELPTDEPGPAHPVLIDDAHRLDPRQLASLRRLCASATARLVLAYRPWPRSGVLRAVTTGSSAHRITVVVSHLDRAGVTARISARLGGPAPDSLVELVHEQSGGLPALVDLVTQALCDAGRYDVARPQEFRRPDRVSVSTALAERMRHHVDALDPLVQSLLTAMAFGAPLDVDVLRELLAVDPAAGSDVLIESVEAAVATGLLTETGALIPIIRSLVLRMTPVLRARDLQRRLAEIELDRGGSVLTAGRRLLGTGVVGERVATVFAAAAAEAESPALAAELLTAAVEAGLPPLSVAGRRAYAFALIGDLDRGLPLADQVIADPAAPNRVHAVTTAATVLSHRGLLASSAELLRFLPPEQALLAVAPLIGTGALADARAVLDAGLRADGPSTLLAGAAALLAGGVLNSVVGSGSAALSQLARAAVLLEPVAAGTLLPDTPAALTAIVAMQCGESAVAESTLRRAITGRHGGRPAQVRHRLLHAWVAMGRGRASRARRLLEADDTRFEPREELVAAALAIGLARRAGDNAALAKASTRARNALIEHPVDLYSLPYLGECAVAAARLGDREWLDPHLAEADALLAALGNPPLWTSTLHWYRMLAAAAGEEPELVAQEAAALAATSPTGSYHAALAAAAESWSAVLAGEIDADAVQTAARRLHGVGLVWEAAHLAGQAGQRASDRRTVVALQACARTLAGPTETAVLPDPPVATGDVAIEDDAAPLRRGADEPAGDAGGGPAAGDVTILSGREQEIGTLVLAGLTYKQIGERLFISAKTVEHHVARMRDRLGVSSRNDLFGRLRALV